MAQFSVKIIRLTGSVLGANKQRDYPILQTVISILAVMIVAVNLVVDFLYMALDPRIRLE